MKIKICEDIKNYQSDYIDQNDQKMISDLKNSIVLGRWGRGDEC